jgi:hypothetical protein
MYFRQIMLALSLATTLPHAVALAQPFRPNMDVPVLAGGNASENACGGSGQVIGLDPNGDGFLSVRSGPGGRPYSEVDRVHNGQWVYVCHKNGPWLAVVYPRGG